ncbi:hypothetical protein [Gracilibacillus saliphilus]|uniref:hypothetical protein n=1 Tax=Gracilibacillus saliphilus TaxID=543890 RepID=UPI00192E281E|nr:hypothetical protein [Gracilibacillus saliphilus]
MRRVKFYSINDLMYGNSLRNSEKVIKEYQTGREIQDFNDIIELYNIKKYFDNKVFLTDWTTAEFKGYQNTVNSCFGMVAKCIKAINEDTMIKRYEDVDISYKDDFWELIDKFKVYEKITEVKFCELIKTMEVKLYELLKHKRITEHFGAIIRDYMLEDASSAELLLDRFEMRHISEPDPLFFPKELIKEDKEYIINSYIESEKPNINYLRLIVNIQSSKDKLEISPKTLLKAKRKVEDLEKQFFKENSGIEMATKVEFSESQKENVSLEMKNHELNASYSIKWIKENMDNSTLLNNFIYLFEFVDLHMRFTLVNKFNNMGVFERYIFTTSQNAYKTGIEYEQRNDLSLLQLTGYYNVLFGLGIRLEELVEWFF